MPLKRAFRDLAHRQQLTDLVSARVVSFNDHFKVQLKTVTSQIAKAHEVWYDIVTREFDFDDHDFNILVEEILGELVFELVRTDPPIVEIDHQYLNPTPKPSRIPADESFKFAKEYIAVDVGLKLLRNVFEEDLIPPEESAHRKLEAAIIISARPREAQKFCEFLKLDLPVYERLLGSRTK